MDSSRIAALQKRIQYWKKIRADNKHIDTSLHSEMGILLNSLTSLLRDGQVEEKEYPTLYKTVRRLEDIENESRLRG